MALKQRDLSTDFKPSFGIVSEKEINNKHNSRILHIAQNNLALNNAPIYAPNLDENLNMRDSENRELSYSFAFTSLYKSLTSMKKYTVVSEKDSPEMKETKQMEAKLIDDAILNIKESLPKVAAEEYPETVPHFTNDMVVMKINGNPQKFKLTGATRKSVNLVANRLHHLVDYVDEKAPSFQKKSMSYVRNNLKNITDKYEGKDVFIKDKSDLEVADEIKSAIEILIRDDSTSSFKIDRARAEQDLAKKLDRMGMNLVCVEINNAKDADSALLSQTKSCALRAAWDGFIERPKDSSLCSEALNSVLYKGLPKVDPRKYNLNDSPVWNLCAKLPAINDIKFKLGEALGKTAFPPERIKELTFADIAYVINMNNYSSSKEVERFQRNNKVAIDGLRIKSGRDAFLKKYIRNHEKDLRTLLNAQGKPKKFIDDLVEAMHSGKSVNGFDGHHNYPISDPDTFEKTTGRPWYTMNSDVVLIAKEPHVLLHMTENNVNAGGRVITQDAKSSHRTIFTNKETGQQFYYIVRVKEGIDGLLGTKHEAIYNKDYLGSLALSNDLVSEASSHARKRLDDLNIRRESATAKKEDKTEKISDKPLQKNKSAEKSHSDNTTNSQAIRPNYRGQRQFGGTRTLAQIR